MLRNKVVDEDMETFKGVKVGDKKLEELEKVLNSDKIESDPCIYGGVELKNDLKEILKLPPKHTIFPKLDVEQFETELQKCEVKCRWQTQREQRENENKNKKKEMGIDVTTNNEETKEVFNEETKTIDFRNMKATDMKMNKRIIMPELDDDEEEIRRSNVKHNLKQIFMNYREKNCDKYGNILENNLDVKQLKSIKELKTKINNEGLVCYKTDKTGKLAVDTLENYSSKMEKHTKDDINITEKKITTIENKLNEHMDYWVGMTNTGESTGQTKRIKGNMKTKKNQIPVLSGTSKDHKVSKNKTEGPELRAIMGANVGPNVGASNFVSEIIRKIADDADEGFVCKSTEEILYKFDKYNKERLKLNQKDKKMMVGSMDIEKWYANTIPVPTAKCIKEMFMESNLKIAGINFEKVARYLGKFLTREKIIEEKFEDILYIKEGKMMEKKRKYCKKKKQGSTLNTKKGGGKPQKIQKTLNTAGGGKSLDAIELLIVATTTNHVCKFGNKYKVQANWGPTGLRRNV